MFAMFLLLACFLFFFLSIVTHEVAHGWMALRCGDRTARDAGRISFNPFLHIDPFYSILLPALSYYAMGFFFGGARPVPVNPANFRRGEWDSVKVALAGPLSNFLLAGVFSLLMRVPSFGGGDPSNAATVLLGMTVLLNLLLGLFNLIPIPPLDGSHVLAALLPGPARNAFRRIGFLGILILLVILWQNTGLWDLLLSAMRSLWGALGLEPGLFGRVFQRFGELRQEVF